MEEDVEAGIECSAVPPQNMNIADAKMKSAHAPERVAVKVQLKVV